MTGTKQYLGPFESYGRKYTPGDNVFAHTQAVAWFQTTIQSVPGRHQFLQFPGAGQDVNVYLNGQFVGEHPRWGEPFSLNLDPALASNFSAVVTLLVRNHEGSGRFGEGVRLISYTQEHAVTDWRMRGGIEPLDSLDWHSWKTGDQFQGPQFFRATFKAPPVAALGSHPIWRVTVTGLGHGSVWVNGHNLGRYPERIPVNGLYIPECWLSVNNTLVIYDEDGRTPQSVSIQSEAAASRDAVEYTVK